MSPVNSSDKIHVVQLARESVRRVAIVDGSRLRLLDNFGTVYAMALAAIERGTRLAPIAESAAGNETLDYDAVYEGRSAWRLLPAFDFPGELSRCLVSGTGLTHKASAENRAAMHKAATDEVTDSLRMYRLGLEGGTPPAGQIGCQPEWFYKGDGSILRAHGEELIVPSFAEDGGEEPEVAGAYVIAPDGEPRRVGLAMGNEFSDHRMERKNYLYLAPSKLRNCSVGPELALGAVPFDDVPGKVSILRGERSVWTKDIWTGQKNMSHSLANLEHHHFKYAEHRRPGDAHIHFFGADAFSFGEGVALEPGDVMEVSFTGFGRPLRNPIRIDPHPEKLVFASPL
ncbi:MAG: AraD1 family protein [Candidatus Acidiferrales bacterium]